MSLRLQPVRVLTRSDETESHLVFDDGSLVAVLVQLGEELETDVGRWFLEAGFGRVDHPSPPTFVNLEAAQGWIKLRLANDERSIP